MLEAIGNIGELVAAIATVATLFYLAVQIRHGATASQAASQQALLDTFFESAWELGRDMERARVVGAGLVAFDSLSERDKTSFTLILGRFVGNIEKGLRLRAADLIDDATLDSVATGMVASIRAPGGQEWWQSYRLAANPLVVEYLDRRVANPNEPRWDELFPYWAHWACEATNGGEPAA